MPSNILLQKNVAKTPKLKSVKKFSATPQTRSLSKSKMKSNKGRRSSIGISSLSKSKISTPKTGKKNKAKTAENKKSNANNCSSTASAIDVEVPPLMPRVLMSNENSSKNENPPVIILDDTEDGEIHDETANGVSPPSPEVEILTVKITPNGSKKVKGPGQGKKNNPQAIFSKFNLPNPVFPKDENFIPIAGHDEKVQRQVKNRAGFKFDPNAPANTNFTRSADQMRGKVYQFKGSSSSIGSHGNKRYVPIYYKLLARLPFVLF